MGDLQKHQCYCEASEYDSEGFAAFYTTLTA